MSHYKPSTPNPDPMYSYYYTSLPRSVPLKNGYEADLEIHQATLNDGKGMLQQEIEKEVPDSSELHRLGEILGETMKSYGKAASSIKNRWQCLCHFIGQGWRIFGSTAFGCVFGSSRSQDVMLYRCICYNSYKG